jgi:2-C-methyl-D-erythritol 4-phosphate cytidylyltransferase
MGTDWYKSSDVVVVEDGNRPFAVAAMPLSYICATLTLAVMVVANSIG